MKIRILSNVSAVLALILIGIANCASAQWPPSAPSGGSVITQWYFNYTGTQSTGYNNPPPTAGVGEAMSLGMSNNYTLATGVGSVPNCDVTNSKQSLSVQTNNMAPYPTLYDNWRIAATPNNGWSTQAPEYTQGVEVDASTVGYSNIQFSFDWYCTTFGVRDLQFQYNLNTSNSAGWTNYGGTTMSLAPANSAAATYVYLAASNNFYQVSGGSATGNVAPGVITVNLSTVPGANNDPTFGVRMVSAYDSSGHLGNEYAGAQTTSGFLQYNNSSGNWEFNLLSYSGNAGLATPVFGTPANNVYWALTGSTASGAWDTSSLNWSASNPPTGGTAPYVDDGTYAANFPDFGGSGTATITTTSSGVSPATIVISNSTGTYNFTGGMIGGGGTLGLLKQNAGGAMLSAPNSYLGGTYVFGGMLIVNGGDNRLGDPSGAIGIDGGATLQVAGSDLISARNINVYNDGGGTIDTNGFNASTSGIVVVNGPLTKTGSGNLTFNGNSIVFTGTTSTLTINGGGNVVFAGSGTTSFGGGGQFNGNLVVTGLPNLNFDNAVTGGTGQIQIANGGSVTAGNTSTSNQWVLLSNSQTNAGLIYSAGTLSTNILLNSGSAAFTPINVAAAPFSIQTAHNFIVGIGANASSTPFVVNGSISGNLDVVLGSNTQYGGLGISSGTLVLAGSNSYTGTTIMAGNGVTQLGNSAALPSTTDVVFDATATSSTTKLDLNGYSEQINSLSANSNANGFSITNNASSGTATLTISGSTTPLTDAFGGTISQKIAIVKQGAGLLALAGSNTYTAGTTVNAGTLLVSKTGATGTGLVNVNNGGLLATGTGVVTLNSPVSINAGGTLLGSGFQTGSGTLNILGGLTLAASSIVNFDLGQSPAARSTIFTGPALNFSGGSNTVDVNFTLDPNAVMQGVIPLFSWASTGSSNFTPSSSSSVSQLYLASLNGSLPNGGTSASQYLFLPSNDPRVVAATGLPGSADQIDLYNPNLPVAQTLKWAASSGAWNVSSSSNAVWSNIGSGHNYYNDNDYVTFADVSGSTSNTVTVDAGGVQPQSLTISNSATAYTFAGGPIYGFTSLVKTGTGVATLAASNSYLGGTTITGGTLVAAAGDSSLGDPSGAVQLDSGATLSAGAAGLTSSRTFSIGSGGNGKGGTFFEASGSTSTLNGAVNITGTFSKAGGGFLTLANTQFNPSAASVLNVSAGTVQMIDNVNFSTLGSLTIQSGATAMLDNSNGSLGVYSTAGGGGFSSAVGMENGASIKGNLVIPAAMHLNFDAGTFSGSGQIQVQTRSILNVLTNSTKVNSTVGVNILLNSLNQGANSGFTKYDVSSSTGNLQSSTSAACTIGGGGAVASANGNGVVLTVTGTVSGNSDLNVANDGGLGGGQGGLELNAQNTYTGATLINMNGQNINSTLSGHLQLGGTASVNNVLPITTDVIFGTLVKASNSVLDLNGNNQQIASLSCGQYAATGGVEVVAGFTSTGGSSTLTVSGTTTPYYPFNGILADNPVSNAQLFLVKSGPNTLMLTGPSSYKGGTTVQGGMLLVNGGSVGTPSPTGDGPVTVTGGTFGGINLVYNSIVGEGGNATLATIGSGATLAPGLPALGATARTPGTLIFAGNLTLNAGSIVSFNDFSGGVNNSDLVGVNGSLTLPSTGSVTINLSNAYGNLSGAMPLFSGATAQSFSASQFAAGATPDPASHYTFFQSGGEIYVAAPYYLTWTGNEGSTWDTGITASFSDENHTGPGTFNSLTNAAFNTLGGTGITNTNALDHVTFDDSGSGGTVAIAAAGVKPESVTFNNNNTSYTLTGGPITGPASLVLTGTGVVILSNSNSYTGGTDVEAGTLEVTNAEGLPIGSSLSVGANASTIVFSPVIGASSPAASQAEGIAAAVPEPGTFALLGVAALAAMGFAWRKRQAK